ALARIDLVNVMKEKGYEWHCVGSVGPPISSASSLTTWVGPTLPTAGRRCPALQSPCLHRWLGGSDRSRQDFRERRGIGSPCGTHELRRSHRSFADRSDRYRRPHPLAATSCRRVHDRD